MSLKQIMSFLLIRFVDPVVLVVVVAVVAVVVVVVVVVTVAFVFSLISY